MESKGHVIYNETTPQRANLFEWKWKVIWLKGMHNLPNRQQIKWRIKLHEDVSRLTLLPAFIDRSLDRMVPPAFDATHLYTVQCTSWRKAVVSNLGKYNEPFSKMWRICERQMALIRMELVKAVKSIFHAEWKVAWFFNELPWIEMAYRLIR